MARKAVSMMSLAELLGRMVLEIVVVWAFSAVVRAVVEKFGDAARKVTDRGLDSGLRSPGDTKAGVLRVQAQRSCCFPAFGTAAETYGAWQWRLPSSRAPTVALQPRSLDLVGAQRYEGDKDPRRGVRILFDSAIASVANPARSLLPLASAIWSLRTVTLVAQILLDPKLGFLGTALEQHSHKHMARARPACSFTSLSTNVLPRDSVVLIC